MDYHARRKKEVLQLLQRVDWLGANGVAQRCNIEEKSAIHLLNELILEGKVHKVGPAYMATENYQLRLESDG